MNSKLHSHKRPLNKHFMSPPISEASRTAVREKNILGERNGADSNSNSNSGSKYSHRSSLGVSSQSCASGSNDDEQNSSFVADSSSNQYDPLTNYLSPRPKYLRYKPNRRREIFLHLENRGEGNEGLGVERSISVETKAFVGDEGSMGHAKDSSPLPPQEVNVQPENNEVLKKGDGDDDNNSPLPSQEGNAQPENDKIPDNEDAEDDNNGVVDSEEDEDDVEEEYFEDNGWNSHWLLKLLLLMVIVFLSPLLASLIEYPVSTPTEPAMNGFYDICPLLGVVALDVNSSISDSQNKIEASTSNFWELNQGEVGIEPDEVELAEDEEEISYGTRIELVEVAGPANQLSEGSGQELEKETTATDMVDDNEAEAFDHLPILEPTENKVDAVSGMEKEGFGLPKKHKAFDKTDSCEDRKKLEISESLAIPNAASEDENFATVIQEFDQMNEENEVVLVEPTSQASLGETFLETQMERDEDTYADIDDKISVPRWMAGEESDTSNSDGPEKSIYSKLQQIGPTPAALAIVSILSLILTYAISIYSARKARTSHEHSNPIVEPPQQSNTAEILTAVIPNVEIEHVEQVDGKRESIAKDSSSFCPIEEASKDHQRYTSSKLFPQLENYSGVEMATQEDTKQLHSVYSAEASSLVRSVRDSSVELSHTKTLGVELLGELVIGGEVSSSLRTPARKIRLPETEESSNSFSQVSGSRLHPLQPSAFLNSQTSESSYGRFTTEKKLVKNEVNLTFMFESMHTYIIHFQYLNFIGCF